MKLHQSLKLSSLNNGQMSMLQRDRNDVFYHAKDIFEAYSPNDKDEYKPFDLRKAEEQSFFWDLCGLLSYKKQKRTENKIKKVIDQFKTAISLKPNESHKSKHPVTLLDAAIGEVTGGEVVYGDRIDEWKVIKLAFRSYAGMLKGYDGDIHNEELQRRTIMRIKQLVLEQNLNSTERSDWGDLQETYSEELSSVLAS